MSNFNCIHSILLLSRILPLHTIYETYGSNHDNAHTFQCYEPLAVDLLQLYLLALLHVLDHAYKFPSSHFLYAPTLFVHLKIYFYHT